MNLIKEKSQNIAILLAAGRGERLGGAEPKAFELLHGKPLFHYALKRFYQHPAINKVYLVVPRGWEKIEVPYHTKFAGVVVGAEKRHLSLWNALQGHG